MTHAPGITVPTTLEALDGACRDRLPDALALARQLAAYLGSDELGRTHTQRLARALMLDVVELLESSASMPMP